MSWVWLAGLVVGLCIGAVVGSLITERKICKHGNITRERLDRILDERSK